MSHRHTYHVRITAYENPSTCRVRAVPETSAKSPPGKRVDRDLAIKLALMQAREGKELFAVGCWCHGDGLSTYAESHPGSQLARALVHPPDPRDSDVS